MNNNIKKINLMIAFIMMLGMGVQAQHYWKCIGGMHGVFLGAGPDGSFYSYYGSQYGPCITRSQDEGYTWEDVLGYETGFECQFNWRCFSVTPEGRVLLFEDYPYRAFFSDDNGNSWQQTSAVPLVYGSAAEHLYAANNNTVVGTTDINQIFWTTDGGASWDTIHLDFMNMNNGPTIEGLLVNGNGDVYLGVRTLDGGGGGIYHSTITDMRNWQVVAAPGCSIRKMAFDPEGNVVACGWKMDGVIGFQHTPGFYLFDGRTLAISDHGIIYKINETEDDKAVLAYSLDHGESFDEIGEELLLMPPIPDGEDGFLYKGYDNHLFYQSHGDYWRSIPDADDFPGYNPWVGKSFYDAASTLYYYIISDTTVEVTYDHVYEYTGENSYTGDIDIPETVSYMGFTYTVIALGERAFYRCRGPLTSVVVPNTVTSIGVYAFSESWQLRSVVLPNSVNTIGEGTFSSCPRLNSVRLPEGITVLPSRMFEFCTSITSFVIPPTVTRIGKYAFHSTGLISVDIPESVTAIEEGAFSSCLDLVTLDVPNTVTELGIDAFSYCRELRSIHLPENLVAIPTLLLCCCEKLTSISIPETVTYIANGAFLNCYCLTNIEIPAAVTELGESAFQHCSALTSINIPESVNTLGNNLFLGCENLRTATLPQGIDVIPSGMFWGCTHLDSINIPESVVDVQGWAFSDCVDLQEMVIPNNVTSIGYGAFMGCDKLSKVELGESVSNLANDVFKRTNNESVKLTLVCHGLTPAQCGLTTFPDAALQEMAIVPCGRESLYRDAWGGYWLSGNFEEDCDLLKSEWYYEIIQDNGDVTYQYLIQSGDTVIQDEPTHILVRINTLYDKEQHDEVTHEYIYERNSKVYWWNKTLGEFTVLYDFGAEQGDEWEIKVGTESLVMHVDAVEQYEYEGRIYKMLHVSDANALFSGDIVCGIGHLTSFFPERLINRGKGYRVEGIRCFWREGELLFKYGDRDCDEIYEQYHHGVDEPTVEGGFQIYPNPTDGVITVSGPQLGEYRITNLLGQTLLTGRIESEKQPIDVSALPAGMYFITIAGESKKLIIKR